MSFENIRERILDAYKKIEAGETSPFSWDVRGSAQALREELSPNPDRDELIDDARAVNALSGIVGAQGREIEFMASSSILNPFLLEKAVQNMDLEKLGEALWRSMSPSVDLQQAMTDALIAASTWSPTKKRITWSKHQIKELPKTRVKKEEDFAKKVDEIVEELRQASDHGEVDYVQFIRKGNALERAYLISFAVTDGRVLLDVDPLSGKVTIRPSPRRVRTNVSMVLSLEELLNERRKSSN